MLCNAYLKNILICTDGNLNDHWDKVNAVFQLLDKADLLLDPRKYEFAVKNTKYLGFVISLGQEIKVDPKKLEAINSWEPPLSVKEIRSFISFANSYRELITNFSEIAQPLIELTKYNSSFLCLKDHDKAFKHLKELFITKKILVFYDLDNDAVVVADFFGYILGACLSEEDCNNVLRPVA